MNIKPKCIELLHKLLIWLGEEKPLTDLQKDQEIEALKIQNDVLYKSWREEKEKRVVFEAKLGRLQYDDTH